MGVEGRWVVAMELLTKGGVGWDGWSGKAQELLLFEASLGADDRVTVAVSGGAEGDLW